MVVAVVLVVEALNAFNLLANVVPQSSSLDVVLSAREISRVEHACRHERGLSSMMWRLGAVSPKAIPGLRVWESSKCSLQG